MPVSLCDAYTRQNFQTEPDHTTLHQVAASDLCGLHANSLCELVKSLSPHHPHISEQKDEHQLHAFLGHHQNALHQYTLHDLRRNAFVETKRAFLLDDVVHDFEERLEGLAFPTRRRSGLEANFGDNEGLGNDCGY
nr:hypothetical protein CFP56_63752 [Quercus suber]